MEDMGNYGYTLFRTIPISVTRWATTALSLGASIRVMGAF